MRRLQKTILNIAGLAHEGSEEKPSHNGQVQVKQQMLTQELQGVIEKTQLRSFMGGGYTRQQMLSVEEAASPGSRCHPGLS